MKPNHSLLITIALLFIGLSGSAQTKSLFGLTLGKKYSSFEIMYMLPLNSEIPSCYYINPEHNPYEGDLNPLSRAIDAELEIQFIPDEDHTHLPIYLCDIFRDSTVSYISEKYLKDSYIVSGKDTLRHFALFEHLRDSLMNVYPLKELNSTAYTYSCAAFEFKLLYLEDSNVTTLNFADRKAHERYLSLVYPEIQDTFFGFTFGNSYSPREVSRALESRSAYQDIQRHEYGNKIVATHIPFGGHVWDVCEINLSSSGVFCMFAVYDSFNVTSATEGTPNAHLEGRKVNKSTLRKPSYNLQESGTVVVKVWVDQYGRVKRAEPGADGTTVTNAKLWAAARAVAMEACFDTKADAPALQEGTITYVFNSNGNSDDDVELYMTFKNKLDAKYNTEYQTGTEKCEGRNVECTWLGRDLNTVVNLSKRISQNTKGENRIYVTLQYGQHSAVANTIQTVDDEL